MSGFHSAKPKLPNSQHFMMLKLARNKHVGSRLCCGLHKAAARTAAHCRTVKKPFIIPDHPALPRAERGSRANGKLPKAHRRIQLPYAPAVNGSLRIAVLQL